jgi:hypothetical protein
MTPGATPPTLPPPGPKGPPECFTGPVWDDDPDDGYITSPLSLSPWVPSSSDLLTPGVAVHVCVQVAMTGIFDSDPGGANMTVGYEIPTDNLSEFNICNVPQQAQRNITLYPWFPMMRVWFPFLSGIPIGRREQERSFTLSIAPVEQDRDSIDPVVKGVIESSVYKDLPLKPGTLDSESISLKKFTEKCNAYVESILCEPESITEDNCKGTGKHVHITLPPKGEFVSMLLEASIPEGVQVGTVYAFDVVQVNDTSGERGGYRIGVIVVEDEEAR